MTDCPISPPFVVLAATAAGVGDVVGACCTGARWQLAVVIVLDFHVPIGSGGCPLNVCSW